MPSHFPHASRPSVFRAPRWGAPALSCSCRCWKECNLVEVGTFQPSLGFKDFRRAARLHSPTNGQFGGEKRARLRPPPRPQLQGFSSSGLRRRSAPSGGLHPRGPVTLFFPQRLGDKGILQPCGGRRTAAAQPGCSIPSSIRAVFAPRTGQPRPGLPRTDSRARGLTSTSYATRAVLMFWGGLGEGGSEEDLPVRSRAAGARWCGVGRQVDAAVGAEVVAAREGFSTDEIANSACTPGPPSPWLEWLVLVLGGRELFRRSVRPEAVAAAVLPPGTEVVAAAVGVGGGEPLGVHRPTGLLVWRLFIPAGTEPESCL
jgi:hypothetical protein